MSDGYVVLKREKEYMENERDKVEDVLFRLVERLRESPNAATFAKNHRELLEEAEDLIRGA